MEHVLDTQRVGGSEANEASEAEVETPQVAGCLVVLHWHVEWGDSTAELFRCLMFMDLYIQW